MRHSLRHPVDVDGERLLASLAVLRSIGADGRGVRRPALSDADLAARRWLAAQLRDAGLDVTTDGLGTVHGVDASAPRALLLGSHLDSQLIGGWLDGALGVAYALETVRTLGDRASASVGLDVVAWQDEEARFAHLLGSRAFCGEVGDPDELRDGEGNRLADARREAGLAGRPIARLSARHLAFVEAHIEQGPVLHRSGDVIAVVDRIVGLCNVAVTFEGEQNHAGTTPMDSRRDAAAALFRFAADLGGALAEIAATDTVWTIGTVHLEPGAPAIIPGVASANLQIRDADGDVLRRLREAAVMLAERVAKTHGTRVTLELVDDVAPVALDVGLCAQLEAAAEATAPGQWRTMASGAGHDAMVLQRHIPAALLFVPSIDGVSHHPDEDTSAEDIVRGCRAYATAVAAISEQFAAS